MATHWNSAADRRRPTLWDGLVALCILALALGLAAWLPSAGGAGQTAVVVWDGVERMRLDLSQPGTYHLDTDYPVTLMVEEGAVRVSRAECPGQDCLHMGAVSRQGERIVCLPNRLVISVEGKSPNGIDGVTG